MTNETTIKETAATVFVSGASRSGTTMLSRMLGQHSTIMGTKETHFFGEMCAINNLLDKRTDDELVELSALIDARRTRDIWGTGPNTGEMDNARSLVASLQEDEKDSASIFAATLCSLAKLEGKAVGCEQTPRNIFYADKLLEIYPQARFVHIVRDPRDVLASQKNRWQIKRLGADKMPTSETVRTWFNYHPYTITKLWRKATLFAKQMQAHDRFHLVRFEDIVADPQKEIQSISEFLGIEYEEAMLQVPRIGSSHDNSRGDLKGVGDNATDRWKNILSEGDLSVCEWIARDMMGDFDYKLTPASKTFTPSIAVPIIRYPVHVAGVLLSNPKRAWIQIQAILQK